MSSVTVPIEAPAATHLQREFLAVVDGYWLAGPVCVEPSAGIVSPPVVITGSTGA